MIIVRSTAGLLVGLSIVAAARANDARLEYNRDIRPNLFDACIALLVRWIAEGAEDPLPIRDLHATVLHQLGLDHEQFTFKHQGFDQKLTGVLPSRVVPELLA